MADLFISYSRKDKSFIKDLHQALCARGYDVWVDWEDIPSTADWWAEIQAGIEAANTFVFIISPDSATSQVCGEEVEHAIAHNKRLVPIVHRDVADTSLIHPKLRQHNWLFFRESDNFEESLQAVVKALDLDLDHVRQHTRLLVRAIEWDSKKRDESFLLRGNDMKEASLWLAGSASKTPAPAPLHPQYIMASNAAETRRQRRIQQATVLGLIGAIALCGVAFAQYWRAEGLRKQAYKERDRAQLLNTQLEDLSGKLLRNYGWEQLEIDHVLKTLTPEEREAKLTQLVKADRLYDAALSQLVNRRLAGDKKSVTIEYYYKPNSPTRVELSTVGRALERLGFQSQVRNKQSKVTVPINSILYGEKVEKSDVQLVAYTLIRAGVNLQYIAPFSTSSIRKKKSNFIQIGAVECVKDITPLKVDEIAGVNDAIVRLPDASKLSSCR